jgi:hypothetical protein
MMTSQDHPIDVSLFLSLFFLFFLLTGRPVLRLCFSLYSINAILVYLQGWQG